jgi:hypothetical protein
MNTITPAAEATVPHFRPDIDQKVGPAGAIIFTGLLAIGLLFIFFFKAVTGHAALNVREA